MLAAFYSTATLPFCIFSGPGTLVGKGGSRVAFVVLGSSAGLELKKGPAGATEETPPRLLSRHLRGYPNHTRIPFVEPIGRKTLELHASACPPCLRGKKLAKGQSL